MPAPVVPKRPPKLPVFQVSWQTYRYFLRHLASFARLAWLPLCIFVVVHVALILVMFKDFPPSLETYSALQLMLFRTIRVILNVLFPALILVKWHQFVLLGPFRRGHFEAFKLRKPELLFLAVAAVLYCLTTLAPNAFTDLISMSFGGQVKNDKIQAVRSALVGIPILILFFVAFVRFFILLPTVAIDRAASISGVLATTRGNTFRIFAALCLTSGFMTVLFQVVRFYRSQLFAVWWIQAYADVNPFERAPWIAITVTEGAISSVETILVGGLGATALSLCFRHLTGFEKSMAADKSGPATGNP